MTQLSLEFYSDRPPRICDIWSTKLNLQNLIYESLIF